MKTVIPWVEDLEPNASWVRKGLVAQGCRLAAVRCVAFARRLGPSPFLRTCGFWSPVPVPVPPVQSVAPHDGQ